MIAINPKQRIPFAYDGATFYVRPPKHHEVFDLRRRWAEYVEILTSPAFKFAAEVNTDGLSEDGAKAAIERAGVTADQLKAMISATERMAEVGKAYLVGWEGITDEAGASVACATVPTTGAVTPECLDMLPVNALSAIGAFVVSKVINVEPKTLGK